MFIIAIILISSLISRIEMSGRIHLVLSYQKKNQKRLFLRLLLHQEFVLFLKNSKAKWDHCWETVRSSPDCKVSQHPPPLSWESLFLNSFLEILANPKEAAGGG